MRWFLVWLGLVAGIVVLNPAFGWLVAAKLAVAPVTFPHSDGTVSQALLGPRAPWPTWAIRPEGGPFTVKAWFGPGSTGDAALPATGFGEVVLAGDPKMVTDAYIARLQAEGFEVESTLWATMLPEIPPRKLVTCRIIARAKNGPARTITASIDRAPVAGLGRVHWIDGPPRTTWPKVEGPPC